MAIEDPYSARSLLRCPPQFSAIQTKAGTSPAWLFNLCYRVSLNCAGFLYRTTGYLTNVATLTVPLTAFIVGDHAGLIRNGLTIRKLEKAVAVRNSLLERFSGKFRRCWKMIPRFSGSAKCYPCQSLGTFRQGKRLLENWPSLRERCRIFSSETASAFLSSSETIGPQLA